MCFIRMWVVSTSIVAWMKYIPWSLTKVKGQLKVVRMFSYKNFALIVIMFMRNTLASTHLVA